eukprot:118346-Hanusia_phi.AAC.4
MEEEERRQEAGGRRQEAGGRRQEAGCPALKAFCHVLIAIRASGSPCRGLSSPDRTEEVQEAEVTRRLAGWKMHYVSVDLKEADVAEGQSKVVTARNIKLVVTKKEGKLFAFNNKCPHLGLSLKRGQITGSDDRHGICVVCPFHKSKFSLEENGKCKVWSESVFGIKGKYRKHRQQDWPDRRSHGQVCEPNRRKSGTSSCLWREGDVEDEVGFRRLANESRLRMAKSLSIFLLISPSTPRPGSTSATRGGGGGRGGNKGDRRTQTEVSGTLRDSHTLVEYKCMLVCPANEPQEEKRGSRRRRDGLTLHLGVGGAGVAKIVLLSLASAANLACSSRHRQQHWILNSPERLRCTCRLEGSLAPGCSCCFISILHALLPPPSAAVYLMASSFILLRPSKANDVVRKLALGLSRPCHCNIEHISAGE